MFEASAFGYGTIPLVYLDCVVIYRLLFTLLLTSFIFKKKTIFNYIWLVVSIDFSTVSEMVLNALVILSIYIKQCLPAPKLPLRIVSV